MDYTESPDQVSEFVRMALPLMARQQIPPTPPNYTVWYDYVSGRNAPLKDAIDRIMRERQALSSDESLEMFQEYCRTTEEKLAEKTRTEVRELLNSVLAQMAESGGQASHYTEVLSSFNERLSGDIGLDEFRSMVDEFASETDTMLNANRQLENRLQQTTEELEQLRQQLEQARVEATTDALTGLPNRKAFDTELNRLSAEGGFCLVMADIDHFKQFNDTHGHQVGDKVLRFVAGHLAEAISDHGMVARFGGEEFAVLIPCASLDKALTLAEKARARIESQRLRRTDNQQSLGTITLSFGVAAWRNGEPVTALIERADAALYQSKHEGRNRVTGENQLDAA